MLQRGDDVEILVFSGVGHALDTVEDERIVVEKDLLKKLKITT
jgi:hypothetical protein